VSLGVRLSRCHALGVRRISLGVEGNALYPMLCSYYYFYHETASATVSWSVRLSVCMFMDVRIRILSVTLVHSAKSVGWKQMQFFQGHFV